MSFAPHHFRIAAALATLGLAAGCSEAPPTPEVAAVKSTDPWRPADATANLPSDTGSQTTLPSGAVTGAGQPQGVGVQPDVGEPGGLERRARAKERMVGTASPPPVGASTAEPATGGGMSTEPRVTPTRPPKQSKG